MKLEGKLVVAMLLLASLGIVLFSVQRSQLLFSDQMRDVDLERGGRTSSTVLALEEWTTHDVVAWVRQGLFSGDVVQKISDQGIDGPALKALTFAQLKTWGLAPGELQRFTSLRAALVKGLSLATHKPPAHPHRPPAPAQRDEQHHRQQQQQRGEQQQQQEEQREEQHEQPTIPKPSRPAKPQSKPQSQPPPRSSTYPKRTAAPANPARPDFDTAPVHASHRLQFSASVSLPLLGLSLTPSLPSPHLCTPTALVLHPSQTTFAALAKVADRVSVELVTVSEVPFQRLRSFDHGDHDTPWYELHTEGGLQYGCKLEAQQGKWLADDDLPVSHFVLHASSVEEAAKEITAGERAVFSESDASKQPHRSRTAPLSTDNLVSVPASCSVHVRRLPLVISQSPSEKPVGVFSGTVPMGACVEGYPCHEALSQWVCGERCGCVWMSESNTCHVEEEQAEPEEAEETSQGEGTQLYAPFTADQSSTVYAFRVRVLVDEGECLPHATQDEGKACERATKAGVVDFHLPVSTTGPWDPTDARLPVRASSRGAAMSGVGNIELRRVDLAAPCHPLLHANFAPMPSHVGVFPLNAVGTREPLNGAVSDDEIMMTTSAPVSLVVAVLPEVDAALSNAARHLSFFARATKPDRIVNVHVDAEFDEKLGGYLLILDIREPGTYVLEVYMQWVYGDGLEREGPTPLLVGPHMGHSFKATNAMRALVFGAPFVVHVDDTDSPPKVWGEAKCTTGDEEGRWVLTSDEACKPPLCSGQGKPVSIANMGWSGERNPWLWVPYACYYHLFGKDELEQCAKQDDLEWLVIQGDSQVRELMGHLHLIAGFEDVFGKFASLERNPLLGKLRMSYYFQESAYNENKGIPDARGSAFPFSRGWWPMMQHFNVVPTCDSGLPVPRYRPSASFDPKASPITRRRATVETLDQEERSRPDVLVWNAGMAYAAQDLGWKDFQTWVDDVGEYLQQGQAIAPWNSVDHSPIAVPPEWAQCKEGVCGDVVEGRGSCALPEAKRRPMRMVWFGPQFIQSQAHARSDHLTTQRMRRYDKLAKQKLHQLGAAIVDGDQLTQSRMEDSYDGLHYMRSTVEDPGHGLVSAMMQQVVLNTVFPFCPGAADAYVPRHDVRALRDARVEEVRARAVGEVQGARDRKGDGGVDVAVGGEVGAVPKPDARGMAKPDHGANNEQQQAQQQPPPPPPPPPPPQEDQRAAPEQPQPQDREDAAQRPSTLRQAQPQDTVARALYMQPDQLLSIDGVAHHLQLSHALHLCQPASLDISGGGSLQSLGSRLTVDLVTFTLYPYPPDDFYFYDSQWYSLPDAPQRLHYECDVGVDGSAVRWVDDADVPGAFEQSGRGLGEAENELRAHVAALWGADGSSAGNRQPHRVLGAQNRQDRFVTVPQNCTVHARRLPAVPDDSGVPLWRYPFAPDRSSSTYGLRVGVFVPAGECLPALVSGKDETAKCDRLKEDAVVRVYLPLAPSNEVYVTPDMQRHESKCTLPERHVGNQPVQSAHARLSLNWPRADDICYPILHADIAPQAQHVGLFALSGDGSGRPLDGRQPGHVVEMETDRRHKLVVRAFAEVAEALGDAVRHLTFTARATSADRIVNVDVSDFDDNVNGNVVSLDIREPGTYLLEVYLQWVYGDAEEHEGPQPILVGPHMGHAFRYCNTRRALVFGGPWVVVVKNGPSPPQVWGKTKCSTGDVPGRWVYLNQDACAPPLCTGTEGKDMSVGNYGWRGEKEPWVWVPYKCYHHLYSAKDIEVCAKEQGVDWMVIMGDSQVREMLGHLHLLAGLVDIFGKFASLDRPRLFNAMRVTYQFQEFAYASKNMPDVHNNLFPFSRGWFPYLHHFNIAPSCHSGKPLCDYTPNSDTDGKVPAMDGRYCEDHLLEAETKRPDVLVWNAGMAYAAQDLTLSDYRRFVYDAITYFRDGTGLRLPDQLGFYKTKDVKRPYGHTATNHNLYEDTCDLSKLESMTAMRGIWLNGPRAFSQAHPRSPWLTTQRLHTYNQFASTMFRGVGMAIVDGEAMTQSRMEEAYDGLHYMRASIEDPGHGIASAMVHQAVLNTVFPTCDGSGTPVELFVPEDTPVGEPEPAGVGDQQLASPEAPQQAQRRQQQRQQQRQQDDEGERPPQEQQPQEQPPQEQPPQEQQPPSAEEKRPAQPAEQARQDRKQGRKPPPPPEEIAVRDQDVQLHYVNNDAKVRVHGTELALHLPTLNECVPTGLELPVSGSATPEQLEALAARLEVELVTVTQFSFPAKSAEGHIDSVWYELGDPLPALEYGCALELGSVSWLHADDVPRAFAQPVLGSLPDARALIDKRVVSLFDLESEESRDPDVQPHRRKAAAGERDEGRFVRVPAECSVHTRRLPLAVQRGRLVAPFAPDHSSVGFTLRVRVKAAAHECAPAVGNEGVAEDACKPSDHPSAVLLTLPVTRAPLQTRLCNIPSLRDSDGVVQSAHRHIAFYRAEADMCFPILHAEVAPLATHFGLFEHKDADLRTPLDGQSKSDVIPALAGQPLRLVVKALPEVGVALSHSVQHASFSGRLTSNDRMVNVDVGPYDEGLEGYEVVVDVREAGRYVLELNLVWVYGDSDKHEGPDPILVGSHMGHRWRFCNARRSSLFGGPWVVRVEPNGELNVWGSGKCTSASGPGRWVLSSLNSHGPPVSSGEQGFTDSVGGYGWGGERIPWVWVPYDCYHHLYSAKDIEACAKKDGIEWLLIQGDSQVREMLGHLNLLGGYGDVFGKFAALERTPLVPGLRVSYFFQSHAYLSFASLDKRGIMHPFSRGWWQYLEHFNIVPSCYSGLPINRYGARQDRDPGAHEMIWDEASAESLAQVEEHRPNAFVWNVGMAYAAQDLEWEEFQALIDDAVAYFKHGKILAQDPSTLRDVYKARKLDPAIEGDVPGRMECVDVDKAPASKFAPLRAFWYAGLYINSQAHPGSTWLTTHRMDKYNRYAAERLKEFGFEIIESSRILQSRWEEAYDGLHYMRSTIDDPGHGLASAMVQQAFLNALFPQCVG